MDSSEQIEEYTSNNVIVVNGVLTYKRWTVLGIDIETVKIIKAHASENGYTTGKALKELIKQSQDDTETEEVQINTM